MHQSLVGIDDEKINVPGTKHDMQHSTYSHQSVSCLARLTGNRTYAKGRITAHASPVTCHSAGTKFVDKITIPAMMHAHSVSTNQNRFRIFGTSSKKFDRSTSFFVAPHVMLIENRCDRIAIDRCTDSPPKKMKKNGNHLMFSNSDSSCHAVCQLITWIRRRLDSQCFGSQDGIP